MSKKKTLLLLTTIATSLAVGTIALMPHEEEASFLAAHSAKRGVTVNADRWQTYGVRPIAKIKWATAS